LLFVSPAARASAPSRHSDRWTQGACRRTGETVCSHRSDDVDSVFIPCFAKRAAGCFPVFSATAFFEQNCRTAMEGGLWPPANWAAAEPDVAGLGSEAMATLCVEQLQLLLQHSESNGSSLVQRSRSVGGLPGSHRRPCRVSAVPAWPTMYSAAADLQPCPSGHAGLEPAALDQDAALRMMHRARCSRHAEEIVRAEPRRCPAGPCRCPMSAHIP